MASPHVSGAAALLCAANPNISLPQLTALLIYNGDVAADLANKTITGRRLNVANSLGALSENDSTAPGTVTNLHVNTQSGRSINVAWNASGDDGAAGQASLYDLSFVDAKSGAVIPLKKVVPTTSGSSQTADVKVPYRHTNGAIRVREFDNVGNEGVPANLNVSVSFAAGDPYATTLGIPVALSTGGTDQGFNCDDCYRTVALPFAFPYFGQTFSSVLVSSNGNIYFDPAAAPRRSNGDADDVPSSTSDLARFKMISGLWDDLYLGTDRRADAGVFLVQPDASHAILRWQGVPCNAGPNGNCLFGGTPINFEVEKLFCRTGEVNSSTGSNSAR